MLTSPRAYFYSQGVGVAGVRVYSLTDDQAKAMFAIKGTGTTPKGSTSFVGKNGYIMDGMISWDEAGSSQQPATFAYYVDGGATGTGYLYVSLNSSTKNNEDALCHMMGCLSPQDVKYAGLTNDMLPFNYVEGEDGDDDVRRDLYTVPEMQRVLLVSMEGVSFVVQYFFSQGMCKLSLCYAKGYVVDEDAGGIPGSTGGEDELGGGAGTSDVPWEEAVSVMRPFVAAPR